MAQKQIEVYVCPTPQCGSYYGHSNMPDLGSWFTGPKTEDMGALEDATGSKYRHSRAACPDCRRSGREVERVRVTVLIEVPETGPPTPRLPQRGEPWTLSTQL